MDQKMHMLTSQEIIEIDALMKRATLQGVEAYRMVELSDKLGVMHRQALEREAQAEEPPGED